jgi:hypothetical protein
MEYLLIEHNSFINNKRGIVFEAKTGSPRHLTITRNIFYNSDGAAFRALENVDTASLDYFAGNVYDGTIQEIGDGAPVRVYPQFRDTAGQDFRLSDQSPACGYGAFPCSSPAAPSDLSHYVVLYPTKDKWIFHIGLVGLDIHPQQLEVDDLSGNTLIRRGSPEPGYDLFANIDLGTSRLQDYLIKLHTDKGDITKAIHIEGNAER